MIQRWTGLKRYTPVSKVAKKQYSRMNKYRKAKQLFLLDHPECAVRRPGCKFTATQIHHPRGRLGALLYDITNFIPVCDGECHIYIETHPDEAKALGLSLQRII